MDIKELDQVSIVGERYHWWIRTRYNYIDKALGLLNKENIKVAEFGCGSCQNLWYAKEECKNIDSVVGVDPELPDDFKFDWMNSTDKLEKRLDIDLKEPDLVLGMDVLEHIEDDESALKQWVSNMGPDSLILLTVPAFKSLWSYHDEFLDHKRRYTKEELVLLADKCGLKPVFSNYAFGLLFPVVWVVRKLFGKGKEQQGGSDLKLPPAPINLPLRLLGWIEAKLGGSPFFGTSVVGIFKLK